MDRPLILLAALGCLALLSFTGCSDDPPSTPDDQQDCSVAVTTPEAGDVFLAGDDVHVRWDATGPAARARLDLLYDGEPVGVIKDDTPNDGYVYWQATGFGAGSSNDASIRVTALGDDGCAGESEPFTLHDTAGCSFAFTFGDSVFVAGDALEITWESSATTGLVDIDLMRWHGLIGTIALGTPDDGSFLWDIDSFHHGTDDHFWFEIRDHSVPDCMAESHHIEIVDSDICTVFITSPDSNTVWANGAVEQITWNYDNGSGDVDILLMAGETYVGTIATQVDAAGGSYTWQVTDFDFTGPDYLYRVLVRDTWDEYCRGESWFFEIE